MVASRVYQTSKLEYIGRVLDVQWISVQHGPKRSVDGGVMTAYEIVSTILAVASLMVAVGMFVLALITFLQKRKKRK